MDMIGDRGCCCSGSEDSDEVRLSVMIRKHGNVKERREDKSQS